MDGIVAVWGACEWHIYDCVFASNIVNVGGGICIGSGAEAHLYDCVIKDNYARGGDVVSFDRRQTA